MLVSAIHQHESAIGVHGKICEILTGSIQMDSKWGKWQEQNHKQESAYTFKKQLGHN